MSDFDFAPPSGGSINGIGPFDLTISNGLAGAFLKMSFAVFAVLGVFAGVLGVFGGSLVPEGVTNSNCASSGGPDISGFLNITFAGFLPGEISVPDGVTSSN